MGDIYEFTTWPKHQNIFYKISSNALVFYAKGSRNAAVGLAEKPGQQCYYWVLLGYNQKCLIQKNGINCCDVSIPDVLSEENFKRFWISWFNGILQVGRNYETSPFLSQKLSTQKLQYVTFSVLGERNAVHWKFFLPPQITKPILRKFEDGDVKWVKSDEQLPDGALIGGHENGVLYIIRAAHRGSLTPGKFVPNEGSGYIPWGGEMHEKNDLEVLCGYNCTWVKTKNSNIPVGAIEGGYSEDGHETLYIGRAMCDGHLIPGKVQPSHNVCYVPYNGSEVRHDTYEILIKPQTSKNFYLSGLDIPRPRQHVQHYEENDEDDDDDDDDDEAYYRDDDDDNEIYPF